MKLLKIVLTVGFLTLIPSLFNSCEHITQSGAGSTIMGNPETSTRLQVSRYSAASTSGSGTLSALLICKTQLVLTSVDPSVPVASLRFSDGVEQSIPVDGTQLGAIDIPVGHYSQIVIRLDNNCGTGRSLKLSNGSGSYASQQPIDLKFTGDLVVDGSDQTVFFDVQQIANQLSQVSDAAQVASQAQASNGTYSLPGCTSTYASTVLTDHPLSYWRLNETSGATAVDIGSSETNASYQATAQLGQAPAFAGTGNYSALSFASNQPNLAMTSPSTPLTFSGKNTLTIEYWAQTSSSADGNGFGFGAFNGQGGGYGFSANSSGCQPNQFKVYKGNSIPDSCIDGYAQDTNWHHYAMVSSNAGIQIYVDGSLAGSSSDTTPISNCGSWCPTQFGATGTGTVSMSEVAIYSTALSAARIQAHFAASQSCH